ncbi:MAG: type III-B CRISPR-associated protein Cas10/Cmr2 [Candidatus Dadabacteria bacterium]|nr:MAG: type III-B CRISPR-associated protein Cas10/Cmr2 [Candidatus Dadabacteria bacterium]
MSFSTGCREDTSMSDDTRMWKTKVLAYLHDPAEKALVLLRGKSHEAGTVARLRDELLGTELAGIYDGARETEEIVRRADRWAAAADRPGLPSRLTGAVVFAKDPQLVHPLTGDVLRLGEFSSDVSVAHIEEVSFAHFADLVVRDDDAIDWRRTFLKLWRFGPDTPAPEIGTLWSQLPADTRCPDHSIWEHVGLASAFAGAMAADSSEQPALLLVTFGPVQAFIAQARSVSDLWAGSHLLSRIAWEGLQVVCDRFGPDAVLFPNLHGLALVDLWLRAQLAEAWPSEPEPNASAPTASASNTNSPVPDWLRIKSDVNPLFAAALPNRFVAVVPADAANELAEEITERVRTWVRRQAESALESIAAAADVPASKLRRAAQQIDRQFSGFPEVHWSSAPWSLASDSAGTKLDDEALRTLLATLGVRSAENGGGSYLGDASVDGLLRRELEVEGQRCYEPNPGVAYPGLFEAVERIVSATKSVRVFSGAVEYGYSCTLCGEREWLAPDGGSESGEQDFLHLPPGQRGEETLWPVVARKKPALAKEGEFLCGWCSLKRAWPQLFVKELERKLPELDKIDRFVLSTHALAVAPALWEWANRGAPPTKAEIDEKVAKADQVVLPRRLVQRLHELGAERLKWAKQLPAAIEQATTDAADDEREPFRRAVEKALGTKFETYYALVLMDGDRLGAWLSGEVGRISMRERLHENVRGRLSKFATLQDFCDALPPGSPGRHQTISSALSDFAVHLARFLVEDLFMGKLIYAGGDDLMAMVAVSDLPGLMWALRCAYSGVLPREASDAQFWHALGRAPRGLKLAKGYGLLERHGQRRLLRLIGRKATASIGAVIAHHQAPLARVLDDLRAAEQRAKTDGGRDAFCITLGKRAGGTTHFVGNWRLEDVPWLESDMGLLLAVRDFLRTSPGEPETAAADAPVEQEARSGFSRRAAYILAEVLRDLPPEKESLEATMAYQFERQSRGQDARWNYQDLARRLAAAAVDRHGDKRPGQWQSAHEWLAPNAWLSSLLLTAEFLAREGRTPSEDSAVNGGLS